MYYSSVRLRINKIKRGESILEYAQIVQDYVEGGKEKTKIVKHLGRVRSDTDLEKYRKMPYPGKILDSVPTK